MSFTKYLKIENKISYQPSIEFLSCLGLSSSRGKDGNIGQFGSGFPSSLAVLARHGLLEEVKICLGLDVYTFDIETKRLKDSSGYESERQFIRMKKQNGGSYDLNISTGFGELEWTDVTMAIREFISNALDGSQDYDGTYQSVVIDTVDAAGRKTRASKDTVRIYVPMTEEIGEYIADRHKYFLCLRPDYDPSKKIFLNRSNDGARIYRKGVLVGIQGTKSLFHYNLPDVVLKESRVVDSYEAQNRACQALYLSKDTGVYEKFLSEIVVGNNADDYWEEGFDSYLNPTYYYNSESGQKDIDEKWETATKKIIGDSVLCENELTAQLVARKGHNPIQVESKYQPLLKSARMKTVGDILNYHEITGREIAPASQNTVEVFNKVWRHLEKLEMLAGKSKPKVMCYHSNNMCEAPYGYYKDETCFIRSDISEDKGECLTNVMLEEIAHYLTQAHDHTREFQEFAFKVATKSMLALLARE